MDYKLPRALTALKASRSLSEQAGHKQADCEQKSDSQKLFEQHSRGLRLSQTPLRTRELETDGCQSWRTTAMSLLPADSMERLEGELDILQKGPVLRGL